MTLEGASTPGKVLTLKETPRAFEKQGAAVIRLCFSRPPSLRPLMRAGKRMLPQEKMERKERSEDAPMV
ncbi:hypothetical protein [uncultured Sutterella sp.]|uniref:hypothetical protein n=1 Tax=uncultured Sutterella sp. TaxID=286133 RepID=UPI00266DD40D|nr:hypothetical protein [uncultured Sutterella sp.]